MPPPFDRTSLPPPGWHSVTSSNVEAIRWDPAEPALWVRFLKGRKRVYKYPGAGPEMFHGMLQSSSKGRYERYVLRVRYKGIAVG